MGEDARGLEQGESAANTNACFKLHLAETGQEGNIQQVWARGQVQLTLMNGKEPGDPELSLVSACS